MVKTLNKSIGLLGGSFDPAHTGHLKISKIALKKFKINKILWLVTKRNARISKVNPRMTSWNLLKTIFLHSSVHGSTTQSKLCGRMADIALMLFNSILNGPLFKTFQIEILNTARATDTFLGATTFFAPALCWWARTIVLSIWAYSLSASAANTSKTRYQIPRWLKRKWRVWITRKSPKRSGRSRQGMPAR